MPPYDLISFRQFVAMIGIGLGLAIAIALARGSSYLSLSLTKRSDRDVEDSVHEFGGGVRERNAPIPVFIWLLVVVYLCWAVGYVLIGNYNV